MEKTKYKIGDLEFYGHKAHETEFTILWRQVKFFTWLAFIIVILELYTKFFNQF